MVDFNTAYLRSCLGVMKISQIVVGTILIVMLSSFWRNEGVCFGLSDVLFMLILNGIAVGLSLLMFGYHLCGVPFHKHEWKYAAGCSLLFGGLFVWNAVGYSCKGVVFILMLLQCLFFIGELLGLVGRCDCYIRVRSVDYHWTFGYEEMQRLQEDSRSPSEYGSI